MKLIDERIEHSRSASQHKRRIQLILFVAVSICTSAYGKNNKEKCDPDLFKSESVAFVWNEIFVRCKEIDPLKLLSDSVALLEWRDSICIVRVPIESRFRDGHALVCLTKDSAIIHSSIDTSIAAHLGRNQINHFESKQLNRQLKMSFIKIYSLVAVQIGLLVILFSSSGFLFTK